MINNIEEKVCLFCCDDSQDSRFLPMYLTIVIGATRDELKELTENLNAEMIENDTHYPEDEEMGFMEYRHKLYIKAFHEKGWKTVQPSIVGEDINGEVFTVDYVDYNEWND